ncbi:energy transducer TonB [Luteimonas sp. 22616]|uniref:energy transducer TonB n=1 Tax=Luteimonas sp. 22616 TaxID=3453951 RepID=UPI003F87C3E0
MKALFAWWFAALLAIPALALAQGPGAVRKQIESSMVVTGTIDVAPDGSVSGYSVDRADEIPAGVRELLARFAPGWKFEPVQADERQATVRARMSVRVVAKRMGKDSFQVSIRGARFDQEQEPGESVSAVSMPPPHYPMSAVQAGASGTVIALARIGRDGRVLDVVAEQVNLTFIASENAMTRWRDVFARSAIAAAKNWTFRPPVAGAGADDDGWQVRVPISYTLERAPGPGKDDYGRWETYVPGPYRPAPWAGTRLAGSPDALPGSGVFQVDHELRLLTPIGGD